MRLSTACMTQSTERLDGDLSMNMVSGKDGRRCLNGSRCEPLHGQHLREATESMAAGIPHYQYVVREVLFNQIN